MTRLAPVAASARPIVLVTHSYYEEDPRLRRQAEAIMASGRPVDVIALRRPGESPAAIVDGVRVTRLDVQRHQGAGIATYLAEYLAFFVRASLRLVRDQPRRRYALVQVASLPDWLVFAALPLRMVHVPVLLDLHESMPDFFASRFPAAARLGPGRSLLRLAERLSIAAASHVLTVNEALRDRLIRLGEDPRRIDVVPNSPSLARFDPGRSASRPFMDDGRLRLVYAGAITPTYELDVVLRAMAVLRSRRPTLDVHLTAYGRGDSSLELTRLADELGLTDRFDLPGRIAIEAVPAAIAAADIGLAPTRRDPFTDLSLSTKILEYMAMGRPVVASRLPLLEQTFAGEGITMYEAGDPASLAEAILLLVDDPAQRSAAVDAASRSVIELSWERHAVDYLTLLDRLIEAR